jgi:hypothetical protein
MWKTYININCLVPIDLRLQSLFIVACQPLDDGIDFRFRASFTLNFLNIQRVDAGDFHFVYTFVIHSSSLHLLRRFFSDDIPVHAELVCYCGVEHAIEGLGRRECKKRCRTPLIPPWRLYPLRYS